nr:reverse transcriptase domain-containing protein [Tanacetum cinerariifolium]
MTGPTPDSVTPLNRVTENNNQNNSSSFQDQILSHISSLETLIRQHNERVETPITPIRLTFTEEREGSKGKNDNQGPGDERDEDLKRPYKEVLKSSFTRRIIEFSAPNHRIPTNLKIYDEMGYIQGVPEVMQISAFMSNSKCLELARRFADQVPRTVTEMMKRVDDFIKSEEAYKSIEFSKGENSEKGQGAPYKGNRPPRTGHGGGHPRMDSYSWRDHYQPYVPPRAHGRRYNNRRYNNRRQEVNQLSLDSLIKQPKEILATKLQLQLPPYPPMRKYQRNQEEDWMNTPITFPPITADDVADEPLIIEAEVEGYLTQTELVGFFGEQLISIGKIELNVTFGSEGLCRRTMMKFTMVRASSPYNIILGRTRPDEDSGYLLHNSCHNEVPYPKGNSHVSSTNNCYLRVLPSVHNFSNMSTPVDKLAKKQQGCVCMATLGHGRSPQTNHPALPKCELEHHSSGAKANSLRSGKKQGGSKRGGRMGQGRHRKAENYSPYVRRMTPEPGNQNREVLVNEAFHEQTNDELTEKELKQFEADDQAIQTIFLGLHEDIYTAVDSCETAQEIWLRV